MWLDLVVIRRFARRLAATLGVAAGTLMLALTFAAVLLAGGPRSLASPAAPPVAVMAAVAAATPTTTPPSVTNPNTDETVAGTFANGLTFDQCVGQAVQLPGCGTAPTQAGDRGGWLQTALFIVMTGGMLLIAWRIGRAIRQRDRVVNS